MANEITAQCSLRLSTGNINKSWPAAKSLDMDGTADFDVQTVGVTTADTAVTVSGITDLGWCLLQNHSSTAAETVDFGPDSGGSIVDFGTIKNGEFALFRLKLAITPRWQSASGTPLCTVVLLED